MTDVQSVKVLMNILENFAEFEKQLALYKFI